MNQRWRDHRSSYRPAGETINPRAFEVVELEDDQTPKAFVLRHHYSGCYPAARVRFGLYRGAELAGVAVFSHPCSDKVLTSVFDAPAIAAVELGRFVLLDDVAGNGETWFLARCFEQLRRAGLVGVVSFSDPFPRANDSGAIVFPGHIGTIYQAHNAAYLGQATPRSLRLLPNGQVMSARALQKIRAGSRGWRYAAAQLEAAGASAPSERDRRSWLLDVLPKVTRCVRHPGNHKYAWLLQPRVRLRVPRQPYPKRVSGIVGSHHVTTRQSQLPAPRRAARVAAGDERARPGQERRRARADPPVRCGHHHAGSRPAGVRSEPAEGGAEAGRDRRHVGQRHSARRL